MVIEAWKQVGVDTITANLSSSAANESGNRGRWPGIACAGGNVSVAEWPERWHSSSIPTFPLVYNVDIIPSKRGLNGRCRGSSAGSWGAPPWNVYEWTLTE